MPAMAPAGRERLELGAWEDAVEAFGEGELGPGVPDGSVSPLGKASPGASINVEFRAFCFRMSNDTEESYHG